MLREILTLAVVFILFMTGWQPFCMHPGGTRHDMLNAQSAPSCSVCGKKISGKYMKDTSGKFFCSKACYEKTQPKCSVCGKVAKLSNNEGNFCSEKCLQSKWPTCSYCGKKSSGGVLRGQEKTFLCKRCSEMPRCFSCSRPADSARFDDGRHICKVCHRTSVTDLDHARKISREVRALMKEKLNLWTDNEIEYLLVSQNDLKGRASHESQGMELGLYRFEQTVEKKTTTRTFMGQRESTVEENVKDESHRIFFLTGIPENRFREVAAHELAHDWMQENYPNITDLKIKEGWAEYVASRVNILYGRPEMNVRMQENPDPIYGDGYRMFRKVSEDPDPKALFRFMEKHNE